jgi:hypothetical protein
MIVNPIRKISDLAYRHALPHYIAILFALLLVFNLIVFPGYINEITQGEDPRILDVRFGFSPDEAYNTLASFSDRGRIVYFRMLALIDSIYPVVYGLFFILTASFFLNKALKKGSIWRLFNLAAIDIVIFDFLENLFLISLLMRFPERADGLARLASFAGMIKWLSVAVTLGIIVTGILAWIFQKRNDIRKPEDMFLGKPG